MDLLKKFARSRAAASEAIGAARSTISEIHALIAEKQSELNALERRPQAFADAVAQLDAGIAVQSSIGQHAMTLLARDLARDDTGSFSVKHFKERENGLAVLLAGPAFRAAAVEQLKQVYGNDPGLTEAERDAQRDRLEVEMLQLELIEEALIREAERSGMPIVRRKDAHPAAMLAPDAALPA